MTLRYLKISFAFAVASLEAFPGAAAAIGAPVEPASASEAVTNFAQQAVLTKDGSISFTTTIDYNFGEAKPHQVQYDIPLSFYDDQGDEYRTTFSFTGATSDGQGVAVQPDVTVHSAHLPLPTAPGSGSAHRYVVKYALRPVMLTGAEGDILKVIVTGPSWSVPVNQASFRLDSEVTPTDDLACLTGRGGVSSASCSVEAKGKTVTVTSYAPISPGGSLTVLGHFPGHSFSSYLTPYQAHPWVGPTLIITGISLGLGLLAWPVIIFIRGIYKRYNKKHEAPSDQA